MYLSCTIKDTYQSAVRQLVLENYCTVALQNKGRHQLNVENIGEISDF
jgi:hypothetical protein